MGVFRRGAFGFVGGAPEWCIYVCVRARKAGQYAPMGSLTFSVTVIRLKRIAGSDFGWSKDRARTTLHFAHTFSSPFDPAFPQAQHSARWLKKLSRRSWREGGVTGKRAVGLEVREVFGILYVQVVKALGARS